MSRYPNQQTAIAHLSRLVESLRARINPAISTSGKIIASSTTLIGGIWSHNHSNVEGGGKVEYTPAIPSNWYGSTDPGDVWQALDQLAARIKVVENIIIGIPTISYPSNTMLFNGMEG